MTEESKPYNEVERVVTDELLHLYNATITEDTMMFLVEGARQKIQSLNEGLQEALFRTKEFEDAAFLAYSIAELSKFVWTAEHAYGGKLS